MDYQLFERPVGRLLLLLLILLEIFAISAAYSLRFDDYITFVVVVLAVITAYFAFHYLTIAYKEVSPFAAAFQRTLPH